VNVGKRSALPVIVLLLLTLLACGNTTVWAEQKYNALSDFSYTVSGEEMRISGYMGTDAEVRIAPAYTVEGVSYTVTEIEAAAFEAQALITYVELPATLKIVGEYAFYDCLELKTAVVNGDETQIDEGAFGFYYISRVRTVLLKDSF